MQPVPTEILDWINPKDYNINNYSNNSPIGCFLEFDLDYPDELHDLQNDYLLASRNIKIAKEVLAKYQFTNHRI